MYLYITTKLLVVYKPFEEDEIQNGDNRHYFRAILKALTVTIGRTTLLRLSDKTNRSDLTPKLHKLLCIDVNWNSSLS